MVKSNILKGKRILGVDLARALAIVGMVIVNFKMVIGSEGGGWMSAIPEFLSGKAAALFVTLAGVGIALMTRNGYELQDHSIVRSTKKKFLKRSALLFIVGLSYISVWPADILHFYGVYILITLCFIRSGQRRIFMWSFLILWLYPLLMWMVNYDTGWDFTTLDYIDIWTVDGFFRNLLYNGFHPVFPWVSFMLIGLWYGRHNLTDASIVRGLMWKGIICFIIVVCLSHLLLSIIGSYIPSESKELSLIVGLSPMPPLPLYMMAGCSLSVVVISFCILIAERFRGSVLLSYMVRTGQLALTIYVAHVIIGMGLMFMYDENAVGSYSIQFTMLYALGFSFLCVAFSNIWLSYFNLGPIEWLFKKIVG